MDWPMFPAFLITLSVLGGEASAASVLGYKKPHYGKEHYSYVYDPEYYRDECKSQLLTCVPKQDCLSGNYATSQRCPINFVALDSYCLFMTTKNTVEDRTQTQVEEYCGRLGTRPYYFQSAAEWKQCEVIVTKNMEMHSYELYWTDSYWDDDRHQWQWRSTGEEIEWEKILVGSNCYEDNKAEVNEENGCLGFSHDEKRNCLRLRRVECQVKLPFFCKAGVFENQCAENKESVCCFSPTYDYYIQNKFGGPGSHSIHGATRSQCWMKLKGSYKYPLVQCDKALHRVGDLHPLPQPVRIDSSYFYFTNKKCLGERRAVISSREVHDFIFRFMMTEELHVEDRKFVIGIDYDIEDDQFHWENGKILTYYNETYWAQGQPDKQSKLDDRSCVAYMKTNINSYSWYLLPAEDCSDRNVLTVCELPIRSTNVVPKERKLECGQRVERGVLARSGYSSTEEYYEEAQYGEFPWHVAVVQPNNYREGVVMVFVCSGALIHRQFVLTSAHCVSYTGNRDLAVSFGEWNLAEDAKQILDTMLVSVADVIIHPGFASIDSMVHDVALLHLDQVVEVNSYPHVGLGCLPSPHLFYQKTGAWECFTVGWPEHSRHGSSYSFTDSSKRDRRVLQRIESDFVPRIPCRSLTRSYYRALRSQKPQQYGYDKEYGYHHATYEHHSYFDLREPELICTEPYESDTCLDDSTPILVCRKAQFYTDDPFHTGQHGYPYGNTRSNKYESSNSRIINAYGKERFDSEKWYVMGVGHSLNKCSDESHYKRHKSHQVFTPVHEYLSFIHAHLDIQYSEPNPY